MNKLLKNTIEKYLLTVDNDIKFDTHSNMNKKVSRSIKDWQYIKDNFVDLGLPSGTLWHKYNLGSNSIYDCGDYYAYGSLSMCGSDTTEDLPYNGSDAVLPLHNDIAYKMNKLLRYPTIEECKELQQLENEWVNSYNDSGIPGHVFKSLKNNDELFIPSSRRWIFDSNAPDSNSKKYFWIWTSSSDSRLYAEAFGSSILGLRYDKHIRYESFCIRPVLNL